MTNPFVDRIRALVDLMQIAPVATLDEVTRLFRREYLRRALANNKANICRTARVLGVHRNTLSRSIQELGLEQELNALRRRHRR